MANIWKGLIMRYRMAIGLLLTVIITGVFLQTGNHAFINFDDPLYVTENAHIKEGLTGENIVWAFTTTTASNWHPLSWLSHMTDVQLFGLNPRGHHLMSVIIHAASALLLFLLLADITAAPWKSLFVAALFALHPLHVESVAWVAERKDVLSGFFLILTLLLYARYIRKPGTSIYLLTVFSFAAGLMTKPMLVTLPVLLLLLDYWPFKRFQQGQQDKGIAFGRLAVSLIKEKLPFFALSALSSIVTIHAQKIGGAMKSIDVVPVVLRCENALVSYTHYMIKSLWPVNLALLYPFPAAIPLWHVLGSLLFLVIVTAVVFRFRRNHPFLMVGWFWFLITLLPVIGIVQVGGQSMADRYTYIPLIGLFIMIGWGAPELVRNRHNHQLILVVLAGAAIAASTAMTWRQLGYWKDSITLYRHTLDVTTGNYLILNNLGIAMDEQGDHESAIRLYEEALRVYPGSANAHVNLGAVYAHEGDYAHAIDHYGEALRIKPDYVLAIANMGKALASLGRNDEAIARYEQALLLDPDLVDVHLSLAILFLKKGMRDAAGNHYELVLQREPHSVKAPNNMGIALAKEGRFDEAIGYFGQALRIDPLSVEAHFNMGVALARLKKNDEAAEHFSQVLQIKPESVPARRWLETLGK
jgi:tetratricopeptide (TPR) repeat protein